MKVAAHAGILPQFQPFQTKIFWFQRGDPDTWYVRFLQKRGNQITQIPLLVVGGMVVSQMNASEHNFLKTCSYFALDMFDYRCDATTPRFATHRRHDTIGTAVVASILHLHLYTCARENPCITALPT